MIYGLADLASPYIQFRGTLGDCVRESKGLGLCGIYRLESDGWQEVAKDILIPLPIEERLLISDSNG
jgi:hypothetical protein